MGLFSTTVVNSVAQANKTNNTTLELTNIGDNLNANNSIASSNSDNIGTGSINHQKQHYDNVNDSQVGIETVAKSRRRKTPFIIGDEFMIPDGKEEVLKLSLPQKIFLTLEDSATSVFAKYLAIFIIVLILLSCAGFVISTMESMTYQPDTCNMPICDPQTPNALCSEVICQPVEYVAFSTIETTCIVLFTIEYLLRIFTVPFIPLRVLDQEYFYSTLHGLEPPSENFSVAVKINLWKIWLYATKTLNVIDFLAIMPFYITIFTDAEGLGFLRVLRLARVLRIFKLGKYSEGGTLFYNTLAKSAPALMLMLFFITIMMIIFGSLIYFFEQGQFEVSSEYPSGAYYRPTINGLDSELSPFHSIPISFYWVVITTTTVGYGDFAPTTLLGRLTAVLASYIGIICVALPITIIGTNFTNEYERMYGPPRSGSSAQLESVNTSMLTVTNKALSAQDNNKVVPIYEVDEEAVLMSRGTPDGAGLVRVPSIIQPNVMLEESRAHSRKSILTDEEVVRTSNSMPDVNSEVENLDTTEPVNKENEKQENEKLVIYKELEALEITVNTLKKKLQSLLED